jgi:hypothetical protein
LEEQLYLARFEATSGLGVAFYINKKEVIKTPFLY